ncbi:MAG TPA: STAS domain-containing protein [Kineosporiaceae bacterium]|nr:STAS domain-containing protein [Kineosporiaceae bacterium]
MNAPAPSLALVGELTIQTAAEEKAALLGFLELTADESDLELEAGSVTELDTAGVQLLLMARREAAAQGRRLHLVSPSRPVLDVLAIAHLTTDLEPSGSPRSQEAGQ